MRVNPEINADAIVAGSWHTVASEKPRQYMRGQDVIRVLAGVSADGNRTICFARESSDHTRAAVGDIDTGLATIIHGDRDYDQLLAGGPDPTDPQQAETPFWQLCEYLRSC